MATLARRLLGGEERSAPLPLSLDEYVSWFSFNSSQYPMLGMSQTLQAGREEIGSGFAGYVQSAYKSNGVVFACMLARLQMFTEARFQYRQLRSGRPGDLFGNADLGLLERPWPNGTTGDLLARMIQDADLAGNSFTYRKNANRLVRLRPDWVTIILGSDQDPDVEVGDLEAEILGYAYQAGGSRSNKPPVVLRRELVAHFAPIPDPEASYRGMSWLTPVIREIAADSTATRHKRMSFEQGGTPNMIITLDKDVTTGVAEAAARFHEQRQGADAYKTLFLAAGTQAQVVGANMRQLDFKAVQAAGETRIAAAAGVPPIIVGLSEGLEAATYSNYGLAMRRFADLTMRPLWRNVAASLSTLIEVPGGSELWYDDRDVPALKEDIKNAAEVQQLASAAIQTLINSGFKADAVVESVIAGDFARLKGQHTGLFPVQMQPPGSQSDPTNGSVSNKDAKAALEAEK